MSRKLLDLKHHLCSGCCMWSGIEDLYVTRTGEQVPDGFFFCMASSGESVYLKFNQKKQARMFSVADGRTRKTYDKLKDIIGLEYRISEGRSFAYALKSVHREIDHGNPVILGPLDMYELPYLKMYHHDHIPMHYVTMVGYDEQQKKVLIYDCDRVELLELTYEQLKAAWNIEKNEVGDKNGFIRFSLPEVCKSMESITKEAMSAKVTRQLCVRPKFVGVTAYQQIAEEFPKWKHIFTEESYEETLRNLTMFFGLVPKLPNRLLGVEDTGDIPFTGGYDRFGRCVIELGKKFQFDNWDKAGELFIQCGELLESITEMVVSYLCDGNTTLAPIPNMFLDCGELQKKAYTLIKEK